MLCCAVQVDCKFLILVCGGLLVAMDQHAAHERVRLEDLRSCLLNAASASCPPLQATAAEALLTNGAAALHSAVRDHPPDTAGVLSRMQLPDGAECLLSPSESLTYEAHRDQAVR